MTEDKDEMFKTDLNQRERSRYSNLLRSVSEASTKAADSLDSEPYDDSKFIVSFFVLSLMLNSLAELGKIVHDAAVKQKTPDFPSYIDG